MPKHTENALTERKILNARSKEKQYKIFDGKGLLYLYTRTDQNISVGNINLKERERHLLLVFIQRQHSNMRAMKGWKLVS